MSGVGDHVTIKGTTYYIYKAGPMGEGKFFGKRRFYLVAVGQVVGPVFSAYGKQVTSNSKLTPEPSMQVTFNPLD